ncbi:MAG: arginine deiminase-related protein [Flavobacteriaceae bacterium]|nr:arginine deiminase-related protein [Flavobacteriaceae bacterium]
MKQLTQHILMVRPFRFRKNEQTSVNNYYQNNIATLSDDQIATLAHTEFDEMVLILNSHGIRVTVIQDTEEPDTPDALFPNNWISFHENHKIAVYPMFAPNRRMERSDRVLEAIENQGVTFNDVIDYTSAEEDQVYLEGTGSMVLDRENCIAYCALSPRSHEELFIEFCEDFEYTPVIFTAFQSLNGERLAIYHTNVMMSVGKDFAVVCLEAIDDKKERKHLVSILKNSGKEIIAITESQTQLFAGNMLQLLGSSGPILVMSQSAFDSLQPKQIQTLSKRTQLISIPIPTIELCGGGSVRCMMAEIF